MNPGSSMMPTLMDTNWAPLEARYATAECGNWMWMYGGTIDERRYDAYKNINTREYIYLNERGDQPAGSPARI